MIRGKPYAIDIQEDVDTIRRQAQRIAKTVTDLLNAAGRTRSVREPVDVAAVVESAIRLVQPVVRDRAVTFEFRGASHAIRVWGDRDRLEQVFVNLLSNAAQAIPHRGRVTVDASLRPGDAWVDVVVRDTGVGIKPEDLGRIFDQFFTTKEPGSGSGLGLSIVRRIVQDHGGHVDVESAPGRGTEFRVALPATPLPSPSEAGTFGAAETAHGEGSVDA
jgi:signal transduction histidine kinase